jgi:tRNA G18 (ribose-2'-O)-methylase SpoU
MTISDNTQLAHQHHQPAPKPHRLQLLINDLDNPSNIGSLFRMADALGVERILLTGSSPTPPNRKLRITSRAADKYVPFEYHDEYSRWVSELKNDGYCLVALEITSTSVDVRALDFDSAQKICLVLGNENTGINPALLAACDHTTHIPMQGHNSSMNVAMAAGIACFEILRGRLVAS